jgi:hypothetical protein
MSRRGRAEASPQAAPRRGRPFVWLPLPGATHYVVRFFRDGELVRESTVKVPRLVLPQRWTHGGRRFELTRGVYYWSVHAIRGRGHSRIGSPIVHAKLVIR